MDRRSEKSQVQSLATGFIQGIYVHKGNVVLVTVSRTDDEGVSSSNVDDNLSNITDIVSKPSDRMRSYSFNF